MIILGKGVAVPYIDDVKESTQQHPLHLIIMPPLISIPIKAQSNLSIKLEQSQKS